MEPEFGVEYYFWIEGEPVPKSTMPPPVVRKRMSPQARKRAIQKIINEDPEYKPLKNTQAYQKLVGYVAGLNPNLPQFDKRDPIRLSCRFDKGKHATGDLKNLHAAIEDGLQFSGKIPNDRQITSYQLPYIRYFIKKPGVRVSVQLDPLAADSQWLAGWLNTSDRKLKQYAEWRGIPFSPEHISERRD